MLTTTDVDWAKARAAVATQASRVGSLLRSVRNPEAPALGVWNVSEVAAHVSHALDGISAMAKGGGSLIDDLWSLSTLTETMVRSETTRDLPELADRIETSARNFVVFMEEARHDGLQGWMVKGVEVPLSTLTCHVLNELTVHGRDIAEADGAPWPIARSDAALIVNGFLFRVLGALGPAMLVPEKAAGVRACMHVRVRGGSPVFLRFYDGDFGVDEQAWKPVDCHLSVDPAAFMLVAWGRINQWGPILRGQLLAWGRRPWLGLQLRSLLRNP